MRVEEKIKENLLKEVYTDIDRVYDFMDQHFDLYRERYDQMIKQLDRLEEQSYLIAIISRLL